MEKKWAELVKNIYELSPEIKRENLKAQAVWRIYPSQDNFVLNSALNTILYILLPQPQNAIIMKYHILFFMPIQWLNFVQNRREHVPTHMCPGDNKDFYI